MLQTTEAVDRHWTPSGQGYALLDADAGLQRQPAAAADATQVSALSGVSLRDAPTAAVATTVATVPAPSPQTVSEMTGTDTAVLAMGFFGAWMMIVGWAMLARRLRIKNQMTAGAQAS